MAVEYRESGFLVKEPIKQTIVAWVMTNPNWCNHTQHTNKRHFKDTVLYLRSLSWFAEDAVLFVVPTKVTRLVAQQVAAGFHIR